MQHIGYEALELLQDDGERSVYRAVRRRDGSLVLLCGVNAESATPETRDALLNEYELSAGIHSPRVMTVLDLEQADGGWFLVWENFVGSVLADFLETAQPGLEQALEITLAAAEGLAD